VSTLKSGGSGDFLGSEGLAKISSSSLDSKSLSLGDVDNQLWRLKLDDSLTGLKRPWSFNSLAILICFLVRAEERSEVAWSVPDGGASSPIGWGLLGEGTCSADRVVAASTWDEEAVSMKWDGVSEGAGSNIIIRLLDDSSAVGWNKLWGKDVTWVSTWQHGDDCTYMDEGAASAVSTWKYCCCC